METKAILTYKRAANVLATKNLCNFIKFETPVTSSGIYRVLTKKLNTQLYPLILDAFCLTAYLTANEF